MEAATEHDRLIDGATIVVLVLIAVPLVTNLIAVAHPHWYPTGDMAQAELHMRGFFRHPPLVGAAGRIGSILEPYGQGSHPGPAMWVAMLPVYLLLGRSALGLMVAVTVVQVAFLLLAVWLTRRLVGSLGGLAVAGVSAVLVHSLGAAVFVEPWNPWLALFPFFAFIAAAWGVLCGHHRWLWLAVGTGVFAVQCHAGYVPLVGAVLVGLTVLTLWRWWRLRPVGYGRPFAAAVATFVAMWVPPLVDQWRREPGNLRILLRHFASSTEPDGTPRVYVGLTAALRATAATFSITGPWIQGSARERITDPNWLGFLVTTVLVGLALWVVVDGRTARHRELARLFVLLAGATVVGVLSTARIFGEFYGYVIRWWWLLVAWTFVAVVLALGRRARHTAVGLTVLAAVACAAATIDGVGAEVPSPRNSAVVGGLVPEIAPELDPDDRYLLRWFDPASLSGVPFGVFLQLERQGFHIGVDPLSSAAALPHRVAFPDQVAGTLWVVTGDRSIEAMRAVDGARELGRFDVRTPDEQQRSGELRATLERRLTELGLACVIPTIENQYGLAPLVIGGIDVPQDVRDVAAEYNELGMPVAAFLVGADAPWYDFSQPGCPG